MTKEHDKILCTKYPKIFKNRHADMRETAMCWGFDCGDGWFWLLDRLCESIQGMLDNNPKIPQFIASQVKEKFGGLRFYGDGGDDDIQGRIDFAEHLSYWICEACGSTLNVGRTKVHWIHIICKDCFTNTGFSSTERWEPNQ